MLYLARLHSPSALVADSPSLWRGADIAQHAFKHWTGHRELYPSRGQKAGFKIGFSSVADLLVSSLNGSLGASAAVVGFVTGLVRWPPAGCVWLLDILRTKPIAIGPSQIHRDLQVQRLPS
jgi:hypothetical protein